MKTCRVCKEDKAESLFYKKAKAKDGLQSECKSCKYAQYRVYYEKDTDRYKLNAKKSTVKAVALIKQAKSVPCMDCGVQYPTYVMEFDHRGEEPKIGNVSRMAQDGNFKLLVEEMAKCDVVCSNCHKERTHRRRI